RHFLRSLQSLQALDGRENDVLLIVGTKRLGTDILDACQLQHVTGRTSGDNAGSFWSSLQQYGCAAELSDKVMCNALVLVDRHSHQLLHGVLFALADCFRNLSSLSKTGSDMSVAVADNDQSGETHGTSALDSFAYTLNCHNLVS